MNDIPISSHLQKEAFGCLQCGVGTGSHDSETLEDVLAEIAPIFQHEVRA